MEQRKRTYELFPGDGVQTDFPVRFEALRRDFIKVAVDGQPRPFIFINNSTLRIEPAPEDGTMVRVYRETDRSELMVEIPATGAIRGTDINTQSQQSLDVTAEAFDALDTTISEDIDGQLDAAQRRIKNLLDPINPQDGVTRHWAETAMSSELAQAITARTSAQAARDTAQQHRDSSRDARDASRGYRDQSQVYSNDSKDYRDETFAARQQTYDARDTAAQTLSDTQDVKAATDAVKAATDGVYQDTVGIRDATEAIRAATDLIRDDAWTARAQTNGIKADTQAIHDQTEAIRAATEAIRVATAAIRDVTDQHRQDAEDARDVAVGAASVMTFLRVNSSNEIEFVLNNAVVAKVTTTGTLLAKDIGIDTNL